MNLRENWQLVIRDKAQKEILKFPKKDGGRILLSLENLASNPFVGDTEKMKDEENTWRLRVGNYRIFYELISHDKIIYVYKVKRRTSSTY
jgi:mRNA interferase RelE/StbE